MSLEGMMDETATLTRATVTQTAEGDTERAFVTIASAVPCSVQKKGGRRSVEDGGFVKRETWIGFFLPDVDLVLGDRVTTAKGVTYDVGGLDLVRDQHWEAELRPIAAA